MGENNDFGERVISIDLVVGGLARTIGNMDYDQRIVFLFHGQSNAAQCSYVTTPDKFTVYTGSIHVVLLSDFVKLD